MNHNCKICGLPVDVRGEKVMAKFKVRPWFQGWPIRIDVYNLVKNDRSWHEFFTGWMMEDHNSYPNEHAMIPLEKNFPIHWIACGDLSFSNEISKLNGKKAI
jgi:hypothetical protein